MPPDCVKAGVDPKHLKRPARSRIVRAGRFDVFVKTNKHYERAYRLNVKVLVKQG